MRVGSSRGVVKATIIFQEIVGRKVVPVHSISKLFDIPVNLAMAIRQHRPLPSHDVKELGSLVVALTPNVNICP